MKIRVDYVSNSSSSSFIINFNDDGNCFDNGFIKILKHVNYITVYGDCDTKEQYEDMSARARAVFGPECVADYYEDDYGICLELDTSKLKAEDSQIGVIQSILKFKNSHITCGCGEDWGDDLCKAFQIATILESRYKNINIGGDDHFDYTSIRGTYLDEA